MIYSVIARQRKSLISHTSHKGNFPAVAQQVLSKLDPSKQFAQFCTLEYNFIALNKEKINFLVMVEKSYQVRIAVSFLKKIESQFFTMYDATTRNQGVADVFTGFILVLQQTMEKYNKKEEVDKLSKLKSQLAELEKVAQQNMTIVKKREQAKDIILKLQITKAKIYQETLQQQQSLLSLVKLQKKDRVHVSQQLRMNKIIKNSQRSIVYSIVISCFKTIVNEYSTLTKDPAHISNNSLLAIWSLSYAYKSLELEKYIPLKQLIPESLLKSQIEKIHPLLQKYIAKQSISDYERNRYILQLIKRTGISFEQINEGQHNFAKDIQLFEQISPTQQMFLNKNEDLKQENKEKV